MGRLLQGAFQGVLIGAASIFVYSRAVASLGAADTALFTAAVPCVTTLAAIFLLAYDNNPQILLLIEILRPAAGEARWQYLLARVSSADLHILLDDNEVWQQDRTPGIIGRPTDYYWHMVTMPEPAKGQ